MIMGMIMDVLGTNSSGYFQIDSAKSQAPVLIAVLMELR